MKGGFPTNYDKSRLSGHDNIADIHQLAKDSAMKLITTIEEVFDIPNWGGLVVAPGPLITDGPALPEGTITLKRPDGSTISAILRMEKVFQTPPPIERRWGCLLKGIEKSEVPIGTEIWSSD